MNRIEAKRFSVKFGTDEKYYGDKGFVEREVSGLLRWHSEWNDIVIKREEDEKREGYRRGNRAGRRELDGTPDDLVGEGRRQNKGGRRSIG